jgi:hypothetical protein
MPPLPLINPGQGMPRHRPGADAVALVNFEDDAAWDALDPNARLAALRRALLVLIKHGDQNNEALGALLKTFEQAGEHTIVRRNLVVANGADIVLGDG